MNTFDAIEKRVSCRTFLKDPVPQELLKKVVDVGRRAPTANNIQPVEFIVVTNSSILQHIADTTDYGRFISKAPACIVTFGRDTKYYLEDGCAAVENMLIAATALGLGTCWVAGDKKKYCEPIRSLLDAPKDMRLIALVPIGFPAKERPPHEKRPLEEVLHWEKY